MPRDDESHEMVVLGRSIPQHANPVQPGRTIPIQEVHRPGRDRLSPGAQDRPCTSARYQETL
jgi:hypothetical protein